MSIDPSLLDFILQQTGVKKVSVPSGVMVSQQGDACENLIIVLEGQVKVYRPAANGRSITLYYVDKNDSCILTASCVLNHEAFPAFAETTSEVSALLVPLSEVKIWLETEPLWQKYIFSLLSERMMKLIELVDSIAFDTLESRLVDWLIARADKYSSQTINITHQEIAEELASSREVISRLLKKLESDGLVLLHRGEVKILENDKLRTIPKVM